MIIYLDICCLKRPFDDQSKPRIRAESRAIASILEAVEEGDYQLIRSPALDFENSRNPVENRRLIVETWLEKFSKKIPLSPEVEKRALELNNRGIKPLDAYHIAFAEKSQAVFYITCDYRLLKIRHELKDDLKTKVINPTELIIRRI